MARIRTIKPTFFRDQDITDLPHATKLTFIGLWTYVDDEGRGIDDARLVKGDLWPLDEKHTVKKVEADLALLAERGRIERYEVDGRRYLRVPNWLKHQRINRPTPSTIPPSLTEESMRLHPSFPEPSPPEGKGKEGKGEDPAPKGLGVLVGKEGTRVESDAEPGPFDKVSAPQPSAWADRQLPAEQVEQNVTAIRDVRARLRGDAA